MSGRLHLCHDAVVKRTGTAFRMRPRPGSELDSPFLGDLHVLVLRLQSTRAVTRPSRPNVIVYFDLSQACAFFRPLPGA